jgi:multisubunit Na+/H+ antiporter MnhB subunit
MSGAIAVIVFAVAGVMYITARGNQQQMEYAKNTLVYGVIGLLVVVFSYFIVRFVLENITKV